MQIYRKTLISFFSLISLFMSIGCNTNIDPQQQDSGQTNTDAGGGGGDDDLTESLTDFKADQTFVKTGTTIKFTWKARNLNNCSVDGGAENTAEPNTATIKITNGESKNYTLQCDGKLGKLSKTINISSVDFNSLTIPDTIEADTPFAVTFETGGADKCEVLNSNTLMPLVQENGQYSIPASTSIVLNCRKNGFPPLNSNILLLVVQPKIQNIHGSFMDNDPNLYLVWEATNTTRCEVLRDDVVIHSTALNYYKVTMTANDTEKLYFYGLKCYAEAGEGEALTVTAPYTQNVYWAPQQIENPTIAELGAVDFIIQSIRFSGAQDPAILETMKLLNAVTGDLIFENTSGLENLDQLENLHYITGNLKLINTEMSKIELPALNFIDNSIILKNNAAPLVSFPKLKRAKELIFDGNSAAEIYIDELSIVFNITIGQNEGHNSLRTLSFNKLAHIVGTFYLDDTTGNEAFVLNLSALEDIGSDFEISNNSELNKILLPKLLTAEGSFDISNNDSITKISAPLLTKINSDLIIGENTVLSQLDFSSLIEIGDGLIDGNFELCQSLVNAIDSQVTAVDLSIGSNKQGC